MLGKDYVELVSADSGQQKHTSQTQVFINPNSHTRFVPAGQAKIIGLSIFLNHITMYMIIKKYIIQ